MRALVFRSLAEGDVGTEALALFGGGEPPGALRVGGGERAVYGEC
jgi:hypothetical protein